EEKARTMERLCKKATARFVDNTALVRGKKPLVVKVRYISAGVFEIGRSFRTSREMEGQQFNQIPYETRAQRREKYFVALASFLFRIFLVMSGDEFDPDGHERNQRSTSLYDPSTHTLTITIGCYDELELCSPPTKQQKIMFANMLMDGIGCALRRGLDP